MGSRRRVFSSITSSSHLLTRLAFGHPISRVVSSALRQVAHRLAQQIRIVVIPRRQHEARLWAKVRQHLLLRAPYSKSASAIALAAGSSCVNKPPHFAPMPWHTTAPPLASSSSERIAPIVEPIAGTLGRHDSSASSSIVPLRSARDDARIRMRLKRRAVWCSSVACR